MAVTQNTYTGNGSTTNYSFTFPYLSESDVRVSLDDVDQPTTAYSFANATTISFVTAPANGVAIRIYRQTAQDAPPATFFAGSAIRAQGLNENFLQQLYVAQETDNIARNLTAGDIAPGAITNNLLADNAVTETKIANSSVTSAKIADGTIVNNDISASAAIAGTKVSPNFGTQNVTTTGDVSANGATITGTATISGLTYPTSDGTANQVLQTNGAGVLSFGAAEIAFTAGMILMWSGSIASIPGGWVLCDGNNSTPDLRDRFIVGAGVSYSVNATGGSADAVLISHSHGTYGTESGYRHPVRKGSDAIIDATSNTADAQDAYYDINSRTDATGLDADGNASTTQTGTNANLPPYYALAFIMKT